MPILQNKKRSLIKALALTNDLLKTRETGLEPATSAVTGQCSNQLNYSRLGVKMWAQKDSNL